MPRKFLPNDDPIDAVLEMANQRAASATMGAADPQDMPAQGAEDFPIIDPQEILKVIRDAAPPDVEPKQRHARRRQTAKASQKEHDRCYLEYIEDCQKQGITRNVNQIEKAVRLKLKGCDRYRLRNSHSRLVPPGWSSTGNRHHGKTL